MRKIIIFGICSLFTLLFADEYDNKMKASLERIAYQEVQKIKELSNNTSSEDDNNIKGFVLSTHIASFTDIDKNIYAEIKQTKKEINLLIKIVAQDIEINKGTSGSLVLKNDGTVHYNPKSNLPKSLNNKRKILMESNLKNSVSIKSASLAFKLLADTNKRIRDKAINAQTKEEKEILYIKQAIFVYEMSDIVINLLNKLSLSGKDNLEILYSDTKSKVATRIKEIENQKKSTKALVEEGYLAQSQLKPSLNSLDAMINAQNRMLKNWDKMMHIVGENGKYLSKMKSKTKLLKYYKKSAKLQIETLRDLRTLSGIQDSIQSLDALIDSVNSLDLLILNEKAVSELLGIDFK